MASNNDTREVFMLNSKLLVLLSTNLQGCIKSFIFAEVQSTSQQDMQDMQAMHSRLVNSEIIQ